MLILFRPRKSPIDSSKLYKRKKMNHKNNPLGGGQPNTNTPSLLCESVLNNRIEKTFKESVVPRKSSVNVPKTQARMAEINVFASTIRTKKTKNLPLLISKSNLQVRENQPPPFAQTDQSAGAGFLR